MPINLHKPDITELKPRISVVGVGGGGGNAVNNMINAGLEGVEFVVANTDAQALTMSRAERVIQLGAAVTQGLGAGSHPEVGQAAAEECLDEILDHLADAHMVFVTAGMGGGTGTGAAPVIARAARDKGLLTVGVVTKPFHFEGQRRMKTADAGIEELQKCVDTLIVIPNQNLFRIANEKTTFADAFAMADQVLYAGVASITDVMMREGLINLDFADVRSVMHDMGKAMMGTGEASDQGRALKAAEAAISNPLLDETSMRGARGLLISITGGRDMTLFEVDEAVSRVREEVDPGANVIFGAIIDEALEGLIRVSVVATGIDGNAAMLAPAATDKLENAVSQHSQQLPAAAQISGAAVAEEKTAAVAMEGIKLTEPQVEQAMDGVMEALEEEMATPLGEPFRPQSQIFAKAPAAPAEERVVQPVRAQARPASAPQQPLHQPVAMAGQRGAPAAEGRAASSRMPEIDDFPPAVRQNIKSDAVVRQQEEAQGPRSLWQRLKQGFIQHDEEEPAARLEPAVQSSRPAQPAAAGGNGGRRSGAQDTAIYAPRRAAPQNEAQGRAPSRTVQPRAEENEDDKLEIPAFLRRQVN